MPTSSTAPIDPVLDRLEGVQAANGYFKALCPAHHDQESSLSVHEGDDNKVLIECNAGCTVEEVISAIDLRMSSLFENHHNGNGDRRAVVPSDTLSTAQPCTGQAYTAAKGQGPETFTALDLATEEIPPVRWAVPDILPEGVTLLAGKPKMGKSWMALGLCTAVATGGVALGTKAVEPGEVLYLALEDNRRRLQKRLGMLLNGDAAPYSLHFALDWPRADEGGVGALDGFLKEHPSCRLVVIDTLARFKPRSSFPKRRTQYDEDRDSVDTLLPVADEHNVGILLVHHLREAESDDPLDMIHGSAGLTGGVDGALVLKRQRGLADAFLHVDGRDIEEPTELALTFDQNAATWAIVGDAEEYRVSEGRRAIQTVLADADEPLSPKEIAEMTDAKHGAVRQMLSQMVKDGQVKNLSRGQYVHPDNLQNSADNPDILTTERANVSL